MADTFIIPDSIEPYLGYKALVMRDGHLVSPSFEQVWPKRAPMRSDCRNTNRKQTKFAWQAVPCPEGWEDFFWVPSRFLRQGVSTHFDWPTVPPPEGHVFIPIEEEHDLKRCACGIYAVDNVQECMSYLNPGTFWTTSNTANPVGPVSDRVLVLVAIWGTVIKGERGVRGTMAYPQKIFCAGQQQEIAIPIAKDYGVALEIVHFYEVK